MAFYNPYTELANLGLYGNQEPTAGAGAPPTDSRALPTDSPYAPIQQKQSGIGRAGGAISGALNAAIQPHDGFRPNGFSALQGAGQGFAAGGAYGALAGAIVGPITDLMKSHRNIGNINTNVAGADRDMYGRPSYNGRGIADAASKLPELNKTMKWDSTNILGLKNKARNKRNKLMGGIKASQDSFNQQTVAFNQQQLAMDQYNRAMDGSNRLRSLYSIGTQLY